MKIILQEIVWTAKGCRGQRLYRLQETPYGTSMKTAQSPDPILNILTCTGTSKSSKGWSWKHSHSLGLANGVTEHTSIWPSKNALIQHISERKSKKRSETLNLIHRNQKRSSSARKADSAGTRMNKAAKSAKTVSGTSYIEVVMRRICLAIFLVVDIFAFIATTILQKGKHIHAFRSF